jgi:protein-disulfide isomerase
MSLRISAVVVALVAVVVGVGIGVQASRSDSVSPVAGPPAGAVAGFGIPRGQRSAPVTLTIYEDFQCPACRAVESYLDPTIDEYVEQGTVRVVYRPMAFLDDASTTAYSSRALGAAGCVLDQAGREAFVRMHDLLFDNQPAEGTEGLSDDQLIDLAVRAGAERSTVASCVDDERFAGWVAAATDQASKDGITSTPTLLIDEQPLAFSDQEDPRLTLSRTIEAATRS